MIAFSTAITHFLSVSVFVHVCRLGDQIISVNGKNLEDVMHMEAVQTLKESGKNVNLVSLTLHHQPPSLSLSLPPSFPHQHHHPSPLSLSLPPSLTIILTCIHVYM